MKPIDCKDYYEQPELWGNDLTEAEIDRISITLSFIPEDVKTILDAGCGDGRIANELAKYYNVFAIDRSREAIRYVNSKKSLASIDQLPFKDWSFDLVLSTEVIEHLPGKILDKATEEIQRVSKEYIIISVPFDEKLYVSSTKCNKCGHLFNMHLHYNSFSKKRLASIFTDFRLINLATFGPDIEYDNRFLLYIVRQLGGKYPSSNKVLCPKCGSRDVGGRKGNIIAWIAERINWRLAKIYPFKKKRWIIALYKRK
ncbi:MAG: class I SAM-dependent methyltransferase [bacterium]